MPNNKHPEIEKILKKLKEDYFWIEDAGSFLTELKDVLLSFQKKTEEEALEKVEKGLPKLINDPSTGLGTSPSRGMPSHEGNSALYQSISGFNNAIVEVKKMIQQLKSK
jgi:hypothetical protein